eukprot:7622995-Pyramimonas_sp.AAC.1
MPAKLILSHSWAAHLHGYFYPAVNGLKNGRICVIPYVHYICHCMDTPIREDIGSNAAKGMSRPKNC